MLYEIHIYPPNGIGGYACYVMQSTEPLIAFQRGDHIDPSNWGEKWNQIYTPTNEHPEGVLLRVVGLEHQITLAANDTITHQRVLVYTKAENDVEESRP